MNGIWPAFSLLPHRHRTFGRKRRRYSVCSGPVHPVVAVSARTGWELDTLVSALMTALPDHAASPLMTRLQDELRTESVRSQAREQFTGAVDRIFDTAESVCIASVARTVLRAVRDTVVSVARAVWNWIFF